jgi:ABC-type multidrug transport system fused ATPase/permease subunit
MARSLLLKKKILVCDESTSSCDYQTDSIIQKCLRKNFKDSIIISIAHRIETIIDYDKIAVIENGMVQQFNSPYLLLTEKIENLKKNYFLDIINENGKNTSEHLKKIAEEKYNSLKKND